MVLHLPNLTEDVTARQGGLIRDLDPALARESFWHYRKLLDPDMLIGWWQKEVAEHLQQFYKDMCAGKRPKLLLQSPPQHGKSRTVWEFISWVAGHNPDVRTIFTSYADVLGVRSNLNLQRIFDSPLYQRIFNTRIGDGI